MNFSRPRAFLFTMAGSFGAAAVTTVLLHLLNVPKPLVVLYSMIAVTYFLIYRYAFSQLVSGGVCFPIMPEKRLLILSTSIISSIFVFFCVCLIVSVFTGGLYFNSDRNINSVHSIVAICCFAMAEEVITRGYLFGKIREKSNVLIAVLSTSAIFALLHGASFTSVGEFISKFMFGLVLSLITLRYKSLMPAVIVHSIVNLGVGVPASTFGLSTSYSHAGLFLFNESGATGLYLVVQVLVLIVIAGVLMIKLRMEEIE